MKSLVVWVALLSAAVYGGSKFLLHNKVEDAMDMVVLMSSPYAAIDYSGVRSTMSGELTIEDIQIQLHDYRDPIRIERLGIDTPSFLYLINMDDYISMQSDTVPDNFGFLIEGLHLSTNADYYDDLYELGLDSRETEDADSAAAVCTGKYGFSPATLTALGYDEQVFSANVQVNNTDGRFSMDIHSNIDDMWEIDANITLAGDLRTEMLKGSAYRPRLSDMAIDYTDHSLNARVMKHCQRLGLSEEETMQAQLDAFKYYGESNGIVFDDYLTEPYIEFLNGKDRITITAKPNDPIAMSQIDLYKASDVPALLNLEAQAY